LQNTPANSLTTFTGLPQMIEMNQQYTGSVSAIAAGANFAMECGIGVNATNAVSGTTGSYLMSVESSSISATAKLRAHFNSVLPIGINVITALEEGSPAVPVTATGTETNNFLTASWGG
jgi:hypothetical protein